MSEHVVTLEELKAGIQLPTGVRHRIIITQRPALARVFGKAFDTNRCLLLPGAARRMKRIRQFLLKRAPTHLLVVGHCDTTGEDSVNDPLSLERAQATLAFVKDDKQAWLDNYGSALPTSRRWGNLEDQRMISAMPGFDSRPPEQDAVRWFQQTRGLDVDGIAGPITRGALIEEYMTLDGPPFDELELAADFTSHGAGEHFPLDESGRRVDASAPDNNPDALDRRVEFFFFSRRYGVRPPPPGSNSVKNSSEYPAWRQAAQLEFETVIAEGESDYFLRLHVDPARKSGISDQLRFFSSDGAYDEVRIVKNDGEVEPEFIDVVFTRVLTSLTYTLEVIPEGGRPYRLFQDVAFAELDGFSSTPPEFDDTDVLEDEPGLDDDGEELKEVEV